MSKLFKFILIALSLVLLVLIRMFQTELFNDPFIEFFKGNYAQNSPPVIDEFSLYFNTAFRYFLNTIISLFVLWVVFPKKSVVKFSVVFYLFAFALLMLAKIILIHSLNPEWYDVFFYVRRFLIQPLFLLILLPAFYYQQLVLKKKA